MDVNILITVTSFFTAEQLQWVLAVVNEEGVVRLYNTECHKKKDPIFRGVLRFCLLHCFHIFERGVSRY